LRLQVLEAQVRSLTGELVRFEEADLYNLRGGELEAALNGMAEGRELPFVLINSVIACAGSLDAGAIASALEESRST
jgi:hypothetical protein